ncbi:hypothetical protein TYRP_014673 [Tyrophagus putrescentiae]|nr:hypothetical protein TYRP_014673 [Tyrophagus putrescentiae]
MLSSRLSSTPSKSLGMAGATTTTTTTAAITTTSSSMITAKSRAGLLYKIDSEEGYRNRAYQHRCIGELYDRLFGAEDGPRSSPDPGELRRLLEALSLQLPDFRPPLPSYLSPIIRFDAVKVPYFEFHCFSDSLPLMPTLTGLVALLPAVDDFILNYSKTIFQSMMDFFWQEQLQADAKAATGCRQALMQKKNFREVAPRVQETADSSGFGASFDVVSPKKASLYRKPLDFSLEISPIRPKAKPKSDNKLQLRKR